MNLNNISRVFCKSQAKIVTIFIVIVVFFNVFNIEKHIFDYRRTSAIISSSYVILIAGGLCIFTQPLKKAYSYITNLDILLLFSFFLVFISDNNSQINLVGCISLLSLYMIIRISGKLNFTLLYYSVLGASLILSITGYLQYSGLVGAQYEGYRVLGPYYNPAPFGCMTSVFSSIIAVVLINSRLLRLKKKVKHISIVVFFLSIPTLLLANSRASWLALIISILFALYLKHKAGLMKIPLFKKVLLLVFSLIISFSIFNILYNARSESIKGRLFIWKVATGMIEDKPLFGFGSNGFEANYMNYQAAFFKKNKDTV